MDQQPERATSWAVTKDDVPHELSVGAEGLTLRETDGDGVAHYLLRELRVAEFPSPFRAELTTDTGLLVLGIHAGSIQRELRAALADLGVVIRTAPSATEDLLDAIDAEPLQRTKYVDGAGYLSLGLAIDVIGALMLYLTVASAEDQATDASALGLFVSWLTLALGSVVLSIGVVAVGVTAGLRRAVDVMGPPSTWGVRR